MPSGRELRETYRCLRGRRRAPLSDGVLAATGPTFRLQFFIAACYYANEDGVVYVTRAGKENVEIRRNEMQEAITATPAISDGLLVIRTVKTVYGIGQ